MRFMNRFILPLLTPRGVALAGLLVVLAVGALFLVDGLKQVPADTANTADADLEAAYRNGDHSFALISKLADQRVAAGNRDGAIEAWRAYVEKNPKDAKARKKLAEQYGAAARYGEVQREYEILITLEPSEENLQYLSALYSSQSNFVQQAAVLQKMVEVTGGKKPNVYSSLAVTQLVAGDLSGARATREKLREAYPKFANYETTRVDVSLLMEAGKLDDAFAVAKGWVDRRAGELAAQLPKPGGGTVTEEAHQLFRELAELGNLFLMVGDGAKAIALIQPHEGWLAYQPELAQAYVTAQLGQGQVDEAYAMMTRLDAGKAMGPDLYVPYVKYLAVRGGAAAWEAMAARLDVTKFNEWQAINLIKATYDTNAGHLLEVLVQRFSDPSVLVASPVLNAQMGALTRASDTHERIRKALKATLLPFQQNLLAELCASLKDESCFDSLAGKYPRLKEMNAQQIGEYVQLHIVSGHAKDIVSDFRKSPSNKEQEAAILAARPKLAAAAGDTGMMTEWLATEKDKAATATLRELFYLATNQGSVETAVPIAEALYAREASKQHREILIAAYIAAKDEEKLRTFEATLSAP